MVSSVMFLLAEWTGNALWLTVVPLAMFTRIYFHCHWFFDTLCGALMGLGIASGIQTTVGGDFRNISFYSPIFLFSVFAVLPPMIYLLKKNGRKPPK
jgi:hypothetical protein